MHYRGLKFLSLGFKKLPNIKHSNYSYFSEHFRCARVKVAEKNPLYTTANVLLPCQLIFKKIAASAYERFDYVIFFRLVKFCHQAILWKYPSKLYYPYKVSVRFFWWSLIWFEYLTYYFFVRFCEFSFWSPGINFSDRVAFQNYFDKISQSVLIKKNL